MTPKRERQERTGKTLGVDCRAGLLWWEIRPVGLAEVHGDFRRGDVIAVRNAAGKELARGLANYSYTETRLIARKPSAQIGALLGYANEPELVHRTNLVLL